MAVISQDSQRVSNWLKHVYEPSSGFCFETVAKSSLPALAKTGSVITAAGALVTVATTANAYGVLVDDLNDPEMTFKTKALVLVRGPAKIAREALTFGADVDTAGEIDAVLAVLAGKNILTDKQF